MKVKLLVILSLVLCLGCVSVPKRNPVPKHLVAHAKIPGMSDVRHWGDKESPYLNKWRAAPRSKLQAEFPGVYGKRHYYLAISGGGANGAYGAGFMVGWTELGNRPEFTIVTGTSTGALMAPFVFLGPEYDDTLKEIYTTYSTKDLLKKRNIFSTLSSDAANSSEPLQNLIEQYFDEEIIGRIAVEHRKGRRLFIGTTNLDSLRPVTWNLGAIAASGKPGSLELIQKILLASSSIPAIFPPVLIDVQASGGNYDELHVDGGAASQVFLYPLDVDWDSILHRLEVPGMPNTYIIRNSRLSPRWKAVKNKIAAIASRSIKSLIRTQGIGDLYQIYLAAQRDGLNFYLTRISDDFNGVPSEMFDPVYMKKLFEYGRSKAKSAKPWTKEVNSE